MTKKEPPPIRLNRDVVPHFKSEGAYFYWTLFHGDKWGERGAQCIVWAVRWPFQKIQKVLETTPTDFYASQIMIMSKINFSH